MQNLLELIYNLKTDVDLSRVIRQVYENLNDQFYENPPTVKQQKVLKDLLAIADRVEMFTKERE